MIVGLIIILVFPFIYFYTQMSNLNSKMSAIKKAMDEGKEAYYDSTDGFLHWTKNGEKVIDCVWGYAENNDAIVGDQVLIGVKSHRVYKNYTREKFECHVQNQIKGGKCWCYERHEYNKPFRNDTTLRYYVKDKYFYYLTKKEFKNDNKFCLYCEKNTGEKREITFEEYVQLGGSELTEIEYKKKNGYTITTLHSKPNNSNQNIDAFDYNNKYLNGGK